MQITVKLPDEITKKMRKAIFTRNVLEKTLDAAVNAGADIASNGLWEYAGSVVHAQEDVQAAWDEIFPIAEAQGYVEDGTSSLTLGVSYRTVRFDLPDPETDPVTETETEPKAGEAGEAQNE
ncbi:MAG TPA: hypothetical protein VN421_03295 [Pseudoflavonifractor sp.]|nr:hypothetical protein [Pseudoflavonifractor sp.]